METPNDGPEGSSNDSEDPNLPSPRRGRLMPAHPEYRGTAKVRVVPPGVGADDLKPRTIGNRPQGWQLKPPEGYETVKDAARRLKRSETVLYGLCRAHRIKHLRMSWNSTKRVYIAKGAMPS